MTGQGRAALFTLAGLVLIACALLPGHKGPVAYRRRSSSLIGRHTPVSAPPARTALKSTARRFIAAFLYYEVGERETSVARTLRADSTAAFSEELLAGPSRPVRPREPLKATLGSLSFITVTEEPPIVAVSGVAHRPSGPEQLSFVFTDRGGRWLASAPGE